MNRWNRIDQFIYRMESMIKMKNSSELALSDLKDAEPDEKVFLDAESEYNESEYKKLKKFRIPRPLIANADGFSCSNCGKTVLVNLDLSNDNGSYCRFCGQRYLVSVPSKSAIEYIKTRSDNRSR